MHEQQSGMESPIFILYVPCIGFSLSPLQAQYMIMEKNRILLPVDVKTPLSVPFALYTFTAFPTFIALKKT